MRNKPSTVASRRALKAKVCVLLALVLGGCDSGAKRAVRERLVDPRSAQFSEVRTEDGVTCGLVNSKNRLGGYTGRKLFVYKGGVVSFVGEASFSLVPKDACTTEAIVAMVRNPVHSVGRSAMPDIAALGVQAATPNTQMPPPKVLREHPIPCLDLDGAPCREDPTIDYEKAWNDEAASAGAASTNLCWQGYCHCEAPQAGPDQLLCDQLRTGNVDADMLSAGKSMREVRQQIANERF